MALLPISTLFSVTSVAEALSIILSIAQSLGLPVTAWQSGQWARTFFSTFANLISNYSQFQSTLTKAGFLDYASEITPEYGGGSRGLPSGGGWLDALASSIYQVTGIPATYAPVSMSFTESGGAPHGPFAAGTFHVGNPATGATYSNVGSFSIAASGTTPNVPFVADVAGTTGTSGAGGITSVLTALPNVTTTNPLPAVGSNAETNAALVARCRARLGALSPNGPKAAYDYFARTIPAPPPLTAVASGALTSPAKPVTRSKVASNTVTGVVTTTVAHAAGAYVAPDLYTGQTALAIVSSTNASPIEVTITGHPYATGDVIDIVGHLVNTAAVGVWPIIKTGANTFTLTGSTGNGVGGATGTAYRQADLDLIDKSIQAFAVPAGTTAITQTATGVTINVAATVTLRRGSTQTQAGIQALAAGALAALFAGLPIGGNNTGGATSYFLLEPMQDTIKDSSPDILNVTMTAPTSDTVAGALDVAVLGSVTIALQLEV